jgi:cytoskeletal protein RodZ
VPPSPDRDYSDAGFSPRESAIRSRPQETSVESLGARLKREREKRKISLEEISLSTKIGTRFLVAIEEEHFDQLPGGIFNKGFVKAYARSVGVDEAEAVAEYELATGASLPEVASEGGTVAELPVASTPAFPNEDPGNGASRIPWGWFAIALLIVAFCFALWGFHSRERSPRRSLPLLPAATSDNSAAAPAIAQTIAPQTTATQTTAGQASALPAAPAQEAGSARPKPADTTSEAGKLPPSVPAPSGSTSSP